jgi:hypothetical protein
MAEKNGLGLQFLRAQSEPCEKDLAALGVTDSQVSAAAFGANILNGMTAIFGTFADEVYGNASPELHNAAVGEFGTINMVQYMTLVSPTAAAVAQIKGSNIYFNPSWVNGMTPLDQTAMLLHEFMHNITGLTDDEIQTRLGLSTKAASQNIGDKLKQDCLQ